jgi:hypothetical protein
MRLTGPRIIWRIARISTSQHDDADASSDHSANRVASWPFALNRARHVDAQHQRTAPVDIDDRPVHLVRGVAAHDARRDGSARAARLDVRG